MLKLIPIGSLLLLSACARLDHVQIGDIDQTQGQLSPISVKISEKAIDMAAVANIGSLLASNPSSKQDLNKIRGVLGLINMGPSTGNPVFNDTYAQHVLEHLHKQCPTGNITGIRNTREAKTYGPVSGEIVRINAFCIL